jgi:cardiolipin synthase
VARCEGPVVAQLDAVFASDWYIETGTTLEVASPAPPSDDDGAAQLLPSGPAYPFENARLLVLALIERARHELVLATPYFVPDDATLAALQVAALSGVRVRLLLSASNNQPLTAWAQQAYYADLLAAGVEIRLHRPHFLHAKHLRVDDAVALIGSINLDIRSFALNAELGLLSYDPAVVAQLREAESRCLAAADTVDAVAWKRRPGWRRAREGIARLADSLL